MPRRRAAIATLALVAVVLAACGSAAGRGEGSFPVPASPSVDQATATRMAEAALRAFDRGDYAGWTADWSRAMKDAIHEADFQAARSQIRGRYGSYRSLGTAVLSSRSANTYRWTFPVTFEKGTGSFSLAFYAGSTVIDGVHFE